MKNIKYKIREIEKLSERNSETYARAIREKLPIPTKGNKYAVIFFIILFQIIIVLLYKLYFFRTVYAFSTMQMTGTIATGATGAMTT